MITLSSCTDFSDAQLADLYNRTRADYLVPMTTTPTDLARYMQQYDVDRAASVVAVDESQAPLGLLMVGMREQRAWITRLGVLPSARRQHLGDLMMTQALTNSRERGVRVMQLEVIVGNGAGRGLFERHGFVATRQVVVLRRAVLVDTNKQMSFNEMTIRISQERSEVLAQLAQRDDAPTWIEETASLRHMDHLCLLTLDDCWLVFQQAERLGHYVFSPAVTLAQVARLLTALHTACPALPALAENIPIEHGSITENTFVSAGYSEAFRRDEMHRAL